MSYYVYILQSQSTGRFYCGYTADLQQRLNQHNDSNYRLSRTTKILAGPWQTIWSQQFATRAEAMQLERKIKKRGIARFLECVQSVESRPWRD